MKLQIVFSILMALMVVVFSGVFITGCDEGMNMAGDVVGPPDEPDDRPTDKPADLMMNGEVKQPDPGDTNDPEPEPDPTPAEVIEFGYYADEDFTEPLTDRVWEGAVVYTKIVFSRAVPVVVADDSSARPKIFHSAEIVDRKPNAQYCIKPRGAVLGDGDAKLYRDTNNIIICRNKVPWSKLGVRTTFYIRTNNADNRAFRDAALQVIVRPTSSLVSVGERSAPEGDPGDFVGQVCTPTSGTRGIGGVQPVAEVMVTVMTGPMSGEQVTTDQGGYYHFKDVAGDELHLLVEREHFEPKEAIVHRSRPTTLTNRAPPFYPWDAQHTPGLILIGMRWPDEVRLILDEVFLIPDLLFVLGSSGERSGGSGAYTPDGIVRVWGDHHTPSAVSHEMAHAHQHAVSLFHSGEAPKPSSAVGNWEATPEGKAYVVARNKDLREVGKLNVDSWPGYDGNALFENAAVICSDYWTVDPLHTAWDGDYYKGLQVTAPNRYKWCQEWLGKKYD